MSNPAHQNLPLDSVHYSLLCQPTPLTFSPLKSSSSVSILNSSFAFLCRSSLPSASLPSLFVVFWGLCTHYVQSCLVPTFQFSGWHSLPDHAPGYSAVTSWAPPWPGQSALIADASNMDVTVRLKYGTTLLPPFWFKGCFFFLVHVPKAHGLF